MRKGMFSEEYYLVFIFLKALPLGNRKGFEENVFYLKTTD